MNGSRVLASACAVLLVLLVACLLSGPSHGAECYPLSVTKIRDADTFEANDLVIRLQAVDAPETYRPACERERMLGLLATQRAAMLLHGAENVSYCPSGKGRYGRTLATVFTDGQDVGQALVVDGLARVWTGKREGWCQ